MKRFTKIIDGKTVVRTLKEIVVRKGGKVTYNPSEEMVLADGWVEYTAPEPTESELLSIEKEMKLNELEYYDESKDVNDCIIVYKGEELHYWANKTERNDLKNAVRDCISMGRETYRLDLRDKGISIALKCELLLSMMAALEVYAIDCFNKTTDHEYAIKNLSTFNDLRDYNFRVGYPEKLRFEV